MKECIKCGKEIEENSLYCPHCGTKQVKKEERKSISALLFDKKLFVNMLSAVGALVNFHVLSKR